MSNLSRIKSLERDRWNGKGWFHHNEMIMKQGLDNHGYWRVSLVDKNGNKKTYTVHRLVAKAFIPNPYNLPCINHKDENKSNCNISNLEWCTHRYNTNYGTTKDRNRLHTLTRRSVRCVETGTVYPSLKLASKKTKDSIYAIQTSCEGKGKHLNWRYVYKPPEKEGFHTPHKPVMCIETGIVYPSLIEASKKTGINENTIRNHCKGKIKTTHKYNWEYIEK